MWRSIAEVVLQVGGQRSSSYLYKCVNCECSDGRGVHFDSVALIASLVSPAAASPEL